MDDIQRKLALIDAQLTGRADLHSKIISTTPLLFATVGLIAGILIQTKFSLSLIIWLILLVLLVLTTIISFITQQSSVTNYHLPITNYRYVAAYLALACFICLGAIRLIAFNQPKPNDIRNLVGDKRKLATIRGLILTGPYTNHNRQWEFARFRHTDPTSSFYLKVYEVEAANSWAKVTGTVRVQVDEPVLDLKAGDYIRAYCWLDRFKPPTNPGQFDTAGYLARKNIFVAASIKSRDGIQPLKGGPSGFLTRLRRKLNETVAQALLSDLSAHDQSRGLLQALLLGYRRNIDSDTYNAFRKTGLLHFISLSGMHLGILAGILWRLCKTAGLMKPARAVVCAVAVALFLLIVPPRAPTLRAAIICWVFCASLFFRRRSNSLNTLSLAAIILLLLRPTQLFEAGWQLSFACVLGILLFSDRVYFLLSEKMASLITREQTTRAKPVSRTISTPVSWVLRLFSVGVAAWLGGKIILSFLLPTLAAVLGAAATGLADLLIWIVKLIANLDISQILIGRVPLALIILYYGLILFAAFAYFRRPLIKKAICTTIAISLVLLLTAAKWHRTHRDRLLMTCLDVGHGQAILVQLPGKVNILFDAGSVNKADVGRRVVAPFLDYAGINTIDAIIISHNDVDHINGIPEIVRHRKVKAIYANDAFFTTADRWGTSKFLKERLLEKGHKVQPLDRDLKEAGGVSIRTLWPSEQAAGTEQLNDNDKSLVSLIDLTGTKILLCSDIETFAQRELLRLLPDLKADIIVAPHHGSTKTLEPLLLKNVGPEILVCSCGRGDYGKQRVIKLQNKPKCFYTPRDGAITISVDKDGTTRTDVFVKRE
ncbi:MAG: DNA internalization-related competence protein ComEC/Rec2 [Planctomycetota bacterium]|jgi:competence protein ComEC